MTTGSACAAEARPDWRLEGARLLPCAVLAAVGAVMEPALAAAGVVPILVFAYCVATGRMGRR